MIKIGLRDLQKKLGVKFKGGYSCGVDTASKTGWCIIRPDMKYLLLEYGVLNLSSIMNHKIKYQMIHDFFNKLFAENKFDNIIIEDTFLGRNVKALAFMSRIGGIVYSNALRHNQFVGDFLLAIRARKKLGLRSNVKKAEVHKEFREKTGLEVEDEDAVDAIILALCGLLVEE